MEDRNNTAVTWERIAAATEKDHELGTGVDILSHALINIVETNKHDGKRWKDIRKIQHFGAT